MNNKMIIFVKMTKLLILIRYEKNKRLFAR